MTQVKLKNKHSKFLPGRSVAKFLINNCFVRKFTLKRIIIVWCVNSYGIIFLNIGLLILQLLKSEHYVRSLYKNSSSFVRINDKLSNWFIFISVYARVLICRRGCLIYNIWIPY